MRRLVIFSIVMGFFSIGAAIAAAQNQTPPSPQERVQRTWDNVHKKLVEMAEDFPEGKYTYKAHPEVRTFGEELLHIAQVNTAAAEIFRGRNGSFMDVYNEIAEDFQYTSKADTVAKLKKSVEQVTAAVKGDDVFRLIGLVEHAGEHYGKLVVYYRNNNLVPPASRPQS